MRNGLNERIQDFRDRLDTRARVHNNGIDLLRLVSMAFVVALHMMNMEWTSALNMGADTTASSATCLLIQAFSFCAVDIFALISGYVAYTKNRKPIRIAGYLQLWLQVVAYGLFVPVLFLLLKPELFSSKYLVSAFFPFTWNTYWYFTAYTGLFCLMPLLNAALRHTSKRTLICLFAVIIMLFSVYNTFLFRFDLDDGYSVLWLALLYILGGIMKKCEIGKRMKTGTALAGAFALSVLSLLWALFGPEYFEHGFQLSHWALRSYTSPTVLGSAIFYVIAFSKLRFGKRTARLIAYASPCSFAVYLLNTHPISYAFLMQNRFSYLRAASPFVIVGTVLAVSVGFVAASVLIDRVRMRIFDLLHIRQATEAVERAVRSLLDRIVPASS